MHKSIGFLAIFVTFFLSTATDVVAKTSTTKTTKTHAKATYCHKSITKKTHAKVVHCNKSVAQLKSTKTNFASQNDQLTPTPPPLPAEPISPARYPNYPYVYKSSYHRYIDQLTLPQSTKNLLYEYSTTPEGKQVLDRLIEASLLGPTNSSITTPIAFASDWGSISAGLAYASHWPGTTEDDGFAGVSMGFGNAEKYVGLTVSVLIDSIDPTDGGFADNGTVAAQLYHIFPHNFALAVGAGNILPWNVYKDDATSFYAVGTKVFPVTIKEYPMPLTVSVGAGTGAFHNVEDGQDNYDGSIRPFTSVGWRVLPRMSIIGEWVAQETNVGVSLVPVAKWPVVVDVGVGNVGNSDGKSSYVIAAIAVGYNF